MKNKNLLLLILVIVSQRAFNQTFDFGVEVQQNTNLVKKYGLSDEPSEQNKAISVLDLNGDTMNLYFTKFSMVNNFEIPVYFRFNFGRRYFIDLKLSNAAHTLNMEGVSNFNRSYYIDNYGTYADFVTQAQANGFTNVDTSDYLNYINAAILSNEQIIRSTEEFKVLSLTGNFGFRLLPHRSIKPYITMGFTVKGKYRKYTYQNLDFSRPTVYDYNAINQGVSKFAENTYYINLGLGAEFYRFRAGLYYQGGVSFRSTSGITNSTVVYVNPNTPFERVHSYGFTFCANLFSASYGKKVVREDISSDDIVVSNIEKKRYKWEFGVRLNRRGFNEVSTFYTDPANRLSVMSRDSILYYNGSEIQSAEKVQVLTFGDVKRVFWSGQLDFLASRNFGKRFALEISIGSSSLTTDIETVEFTGTTIHDTIGNYWLFTNNEPRVRAGVYRNIFNLTNFATALSFKIVDRDLFYFSIVVGSGFTAMLHRSLQFVDLPDGVNELEIYQTIDQNYYNIGNTNIYAYQGSMTSDINTTPDELFNKFGNTKLNSDWPTPEKQRSSYPMVKLGFEAGIDRFTLAVYVDRSKSYMDGFLLNKYASIYFSVGYKLIRR
ncbi:MAG: hypothetical protein IPM74_11235 [Crocinitomicaceae bacterium]|nr:hypothetical protein [Crocinitomicaceae bacterium]MBK8926455.1 hypothetical protein [Crocinitomicaceae bacterium]